MTAPYFLTLAPIDSSLPAQAVAFSPSDHIQLLLGGVHVDYYRRRRPPHHTADFIFDEQRITPDHCDLTLFHQTPYLTNRDSDGTTRVNGHPLPKDERVVLRHGDKIEIGYLGEYNGVFSSTLALAVHISTSPPDFGLQPLSSDSLLSASTSAFVGFRAVQDLEQQLRRELASVRKQLQDALDAAAAHTCVSPSSPRPYGTLLSDLRDRVLDDSAVASSASSAPSAGSFSSDPTPKTLPSPQPVADFVLESTALGSTLFATDTSSTPPTSNSTSAPTSVLTSVLGSVHSSPLASVSVSSSSAPAQATFSPSELEPSQLQSAASLVPVTSPSTSIIGLNSASLLSSAPASALGSTSTFIARSRSPLTSASHPIPAVPPSPTSTSIASLPSSHTPTSELTSALRSATPSRTSSGLKRSSTYSSPSPSAASVITALTRIRDAWMQARTVLLRSTTHSISSIRPSPPVSSSSSTQVALERVVSAWLHARAESSSSGFFGQTPASPFARPHHSRSGMFFFVEPFYFSS
ncbi:hypothetical protein CF319_g6585 [Tilletia indica]|nr:hypothetical protein CF319_g6585 [Tilletia indica]